jgi:RNA polymerase sigma-70 factor (ECF subfamily)
MEDVSLVLECVNGNAKAQQELFEKFSRKMLTVCLRYTNNVEEAEDILQEGFIKTFSKLHLFNKEGSLEGWIRRIMVNTAIDAIRKNTKYVKDVSLDVVDYQLGINDYVLEKLNEKDLLLLINSIPNGYKVVFNMFAIEGYGHKEIAEILGISESTSKSQYMRAKSYLKERLETQGYER